MPDGPARIGIVLKGYPRLSETFIAQEILALEERGFRLRLVSLRHPTDRQQHPVHAQIQAPVTYLPEYVHHELTRVLRAWAAVRGRPGYPMAFAAWRADLRRDPSRSRIRRFAQALVLAAELPPDVVHLHAHFMHTPASVTRYAAAIMGLSWSFSAHAKDIWTTPQWEKREKIAQARFAVTCTAHNARHLCDLGCGAVDLVYHGLDLRRFPSPDAPRANRDGSTADKAVRLLSVGRAVEKKGYAVLIGALSRLPSTLHWHLDHVGEGPLLERLKAQAVAAGIDHAITWHGALAQSEVIARYRSADLFVLSSVIASDGDRDGLPNVLMEAQSQGLACVASRVSGVPELIHDQVTGVLVPPADPAALCDVLARLMVDVAQRARLGAAGERRIRADFSMHENIAALAEHLSRVVTRHEARAA